MPLAFQVDPDTTFLCLFKIVRAESVRTDGRKLRCTEFKTRDPARPYYEARLQGAGSWEHRHCRPGAGWAPPAGPFPPTFHVTVSWGWWSPKRANPRVLPSRSAPVVRHSRPLCHPAGRADPLPSAVTRNRRGGGAAVQAALPPPLLPALGTRPALTFLFVTPQLRQLPRPGTGKARGKRRRTARFRHCLSCPEDNLPPLCLPGRRSPQTASEQSRKTCRLNRRLQLLISSAFGSSFLLLRPLPRAGQRPTVPSRRPCWACRLLGVTRFPLW